MAVIRRLVSGGVLFGVDGRGLGFVGKGCNGNKEGGCWVVE